MKIKLYPDPELRQRAAEVDLNDAVKELADEMVRLLTLRGGWGLAAPQVGVSKRLIVVDVDGFFAVLINPSIIGKSKEKQKGIEGCLSLPGIEAEVERAEKVRVRAQKLEGEEVEIEGSGLLSRVLQHEIDHLEGVLFIDHLGEAKRTMLLKEYEKKLKEA